MTNDVIGFDSIAAQRGNADCLRDLLAASKLGGQIFRCRWSVGFVGWVEFVAYALSETFIEGAQHHRRLVIFDDVAQRFRESLDCIVRFTEAVACIRGQALPATEDINAGINQKKGLLEH